MRTRVLAVLLAFVVLATAGFALPLLTVTATERTQQLLLARTADLDRFAALADQAVAAREIRRRCWPRSRATPSSTARASWW